MSEQLLDGGLKGFFKKHLGWVITGFLTLIFWMQTCNLQKQIREGKDQITALEIEGQELKTTISKQGRTIYAQNAIITSSTQSLNSLTDSIFDLKKKDAKNTETIAYFKNITKTSITKIDVPYLDTLKLKEFEDSLIARYPGINTDSLIQVPVSASLSSPYFQIGATIQKQGLRVDFLSIPDTLQLRFVEHKGGLFKRGSIEAQYFHSNPLVQNLSSNSVFYKPKKQSFIKRFLIPVAVGVGAGILISR